MNMSTSIPAEPKKLICYVEGLAMTAVTGMSDCVNAVSKDLRVVIVDGGNGRHGRRQGDAIGHKRSLSLII